MVFEDELIPCIPDKVDGSRVDGIGDLLLCMGGPVSGQGRCHVCSWDATRKRPPLLKRISNLCGVRAKSEEMGLIFICVVAETTLQV